MTTTSPLEHISESAQALRRRLDTALQEMTSVGTRMGLPSAPESFEATRQRMQENAYTVLVMGEAKRGKSTLVNALMGQDLLPTDVDISTNQVFHVRWAEQPKFRLRFEDNSTKDIRASDLMLYGSQTVESPVGERIRTQSALRWIEVEGPFPFIASNIQILDSPGLGSLRSAI
jgi:septin family protein